MNRIYQIRELGERGKGVAGDECLCVFIYYTPFSRCSFYPVVVVVDVRYEMKRIRASQFGIGIGIVGIVIERYILMHGCNGVEWNSSTV